MKKNLFKSWKLNEGFLPDFHIPLHYQIIFKVSYVFRFLLNTNILHLNNFIVLFRYMHD